MARKAGIVFRLDNAQLERGMGEGLGARASALFLLLLEVAAFPLGP